MAHYAYLDENNIVTQVIVGKDENEGGIDWEQYYGAVRCSYNTRGGVHLTGGTPFRYNYPAIGWHFDKNFGNDGAFIPPKPFDSWILNTESALWEAPVDMPVGMGPHDWDEKSLSWIPVEL